MRFEKTERGRKVTQVDTSRVGNRNANSSVQYKIGTGTEVRHRGVNDFSGSL